MIGRTRLRRSQAFGEKTRQAHSELQLPTARSKGTHERHQNDKIIKAYSLDELASYYQSQDYHGGRQCGCNDGRCESIPTKIQLFVVCFRRHN
jgi:hypothetical protein